MINRGWAAEYLKRRFLQILQGVAAKLLREIATTLTTNLIEVNIGL